MLCMAVASKMKSLRICPWVFITILVLAILWILINTLIIPIDHYCCIIIMDVYFIIL